MIKVELFEMARRIAGVAEIEVEGATLRDVLAAVRAAYPALDPDVIRGDILAPHWRAGLNGRDWIDDPDQVLSEGDTVLLISALAGG